MHAGAQFDVAVVGLGVNGAATAWRLAERGARVVALDRFAPPHPFGASQGRTRIIREAYFEGDDYVPLVRRAFDDWRTLEAMTPLPLYRRTGGLTIAPDGGIIVEQVAAAAERHGVDIERLNGDELRRAFPGFNFRDDDNGIYEPQAGVLAAERAVEALLAAGRRLGVDMRLGEAVRSWMPDGSGVCVRTSRGEVRAGILVLAAGAWLDSLCPVPRPPLEVERSVIHWFEPSSAELDTATLPVFIEELEGGILWYGVPEDGLLKVGYHHGGEVGSPDALRRDVEPDEVRRARQLLRSLIPEAAGAHRAAGVCPYTNTPDGHFLIDRHPLQPRVVIVSACSGHGFKFAPVTGDIAASIALEGDAARVPALFRWRWQ